MASITLASVDDFHKMFALYQFLDHCYELQKQITVSPYVKATFALVDNSAPWYPELGSYHESVASLYSEAD